MKNFKPLLFLTLLTLLVLGCRVDDNLAPEQELKGQNNLLSVSEIPDIMNRLHEKFNFKAGDQAGANTDVGSAIGTIHLDKVFEIIDTLGNANYTFSVDDEDDSPYNFTNLIIKKRDGGIIDEPYLLEYTPDSAFVEQFVKSGFAMDQFQGEIRKRYLTNFSANNGNRANLSEGSDPFLDPAICDVTTSFSGGNATGGGGDGSDGVPDITEGLDTSPGSSGKWTCTRYLEPVEVRTRWKDGTCCDSHTEFKYVTTCNYVNSNGANDDDGCPDPESEEIGILTNREMLTRFENLRISLLQDSTKLINIKCSELLKWQPIGAFKPPKSVVNKITMLEQEYPDLKALFTGDFDIQRIENAVGNVVNLDYFSVKVDKLPQGMSATALLKRIRTDFNSFINTDFSEFTPYDLVNTGVNEESLWNSDNPLGALLHIEIPKDEGSVVCSDYSPNQWKFTTIRAPKDWDHPVTGNREFGFTEQPDGSYIYYTRGVDRITESLNQLLGERKTFNGADNLWKSFQDGVESFVLQNGGTAKKQIPIIGRPDWDEIENFILGKKSIDSVGCKN